MTALGILVFDAIFTYFLNEIYLHFLNIFYYCVFVVFAGVSARRVSIGFNLVSDEMLKDINDILVFNGFVAFLLVLNLIYTLIAKIVNILLCLKEGKVCPCNIFLTLVSTAYFFKNVLTFFLFCFLNCFMVFIFLVKFNKLRRHLKGYLSGNKEHFKKIR